MSRSFSVHTEELKIVEYKMKPGSLFKIILALILFLTLGLSVKLYGGRALDIDIMAITQIDLLRDNGILKTFMQFISFLGSEIFLIPVIAIVLIRLMVKKDYEFSIKLFSSTALVSILNQIVKHIVYRVRPLEFMMVSASGMSFPSGHSMTNLCLYLILAHIYSERHPENKYLYYSIAILSGSLMGFSRIFLGVHWLSDVLAGFALGYICYAFIVNIKISNVVEM